MFPIKLPLRRLLLIMVFVALSMSVLSAQDEEGYVIPDNPEGADPSTVIATVGDAEITLEDFFERVRYERFLRFNLLQTVVDQAGPEILNLQDPANQLAPQIAQFLQNIANTQPFAQQIYRSMILEQLYHQEVEERGLEIDECAINQIWVGLLNDPTLQTAECEFVEGLDEARQSFIDRAMTFSGMSEDEVRNLVRVQAEFDAVFEALGEEVELADVETITTSHIRVSDEETAQAVMDALDAGEEWYSVMFEYTEDTGVMGAGGTAVPLRRGSAEFDEAIFVPEVEAGDIVGPLQTQGGIFIFQVIEKSDGIRVSHMLFSEEGEANTAVELLVEDNVDFAALAAQYSQDTATAAAGGDIGYLAEGSQQLPQALNDALFAAEEGEVVGPIETEAGFHVAMVTETNVPAQADVRYILLDDQAQVDEVMERINAGEDFATLSSLYSVDGGGNLGDTYSIITGGQSTGAYTLDEMFEQFPALALGLRDVEEGQIVGPLNTQFGLFIVRVEELATRPPTEQERLLATQEFVDEWQVTQLEEALTEDSDVWRQYMVFDPVPSDVSADLAELDTVIETAEAGAEEFRVANSIPNVLTRLTVSTPVVPEIELTPEVTPEVMPEVTPEADDVEVTPEATEEAAG